MDWRPEKRPWQLSIVLPPSRSTGQQHLVAPSGDYRHPHFGGDNRPSPGAAVQFLRPHRPSAAAPRSAEDPDDGRNAPARGRSRSPGLAGPHRARRRERLGMVPARNIQYISVSVEAPADPLLPRPLLNNAKQVQTPIRALVAFALQGAAASLIRRNYSRVSGQDASGEYEEWRCDQVTRLTWRLAILAGLFVFGLMVMSAPRHLHPGHSSTTTTSPKASEPCRSAKYAAPRRHPDRQGFRSRHLPRHLRRLG